jgi:rhodanese-related sulfurtransferase
MTGMGMAIAFALAASTAPRPYCGIHSIATASFLVGRPCAIARELVKPQFIPSREGSSASELAAAAESLGLSARVEVHATGLDLCLTGLPMAMHVRQPGFRQPFDHWVLLIDIAGGNADVFDGGAGVVRLPLGELLSRWDGLCVAVAPDGATMYSDVCARTAARVAAGAALLGLGIALAATLAWGLRNRVIAFRIVVLAMACAAAAAVVHVAVPWGLGSASACIETRVALSDAELPSATLDEAVAAGRDAGQGLVDCRFEADFLAGSLHGAVSYPVNADRELRLLRRRDWQAKSRLVLFCQSERCDFAKAVGRELANRGFQDVRIYSGGYREWQRMQNDKDDIRP